MREKTGEEHLLIPLDAPQLSPGSSCKVISHAAMRQARAKRGSQTFLVMVTDQNQKKSESPPEPESSDFQQKIAAVLNKYPVMDKTTLPPFPKDRGVAHEIELEPGAQPPSKRPYRLALVKA